MRTEFIKGGLTALDLVENQMEKQQEIPDYRITVERHNQIATHNNVVNSIQKTISGIRAAFLEDDEEFVLDKLCDKMGKINE